MALGFRTLADRLTQRRMLRAWERAERQAPEMGPADLRDLRQRARQMRRSVDRAILAAEARLARPAGEPVIPQPLNCDWAYRPDLWRGRLSPSGMAAVESRTRFGEEVALYHDCAVSELTCRQVVNTGETHVAPYGLKLEVFRFDGSFLSLAVDLPQAAAQGLVKQHVIRMAAVIETERPLEIFARLNVRHGPNTEQIVREVPAGGQEVAVDFDLAYSRLNEKRVEKVWLDLIFEGPEMNEIVLRDLTLTRRPRAEF